MALYDPNEFPEAEVEPFPVADFLAWARTKPADEEYCFTDARNCAVAQFGRETHRLHLVDVADLSIDYPGIERTVNPNSDDFTFGGLVRRLARLAR